LNRCALSGFFKKTQVNFCAKRKMFRQRNGGGSVTFSSSSSTSSSKKEGGRLREKEEGGFLKPQTPTHCLRGMAKYTNK